jgi:hypothetical protein
MRQTILLLLRASVAAGMCISSRCLATNCGIHFTEPLPSNDSMNTQTDERDLWSTPLILAQVPWYSKFRKNWFRQSEVYRGDSQTHREHDLLSLVLFSQSIESRLMKHVDKVLIQKMKSSVLLLDIMKIDY